MSRSGKRRRKISPFLAVPVTLFVLFLIFIGVFYVSDSNAEVVGNTRYTTSEIRQMVLNSFWNRNSLYLSLIQKNVVPEDAPFVESIDIIYEGHNRVTLHVNENNPIGYVEQAGVDYYFDSKGLVLEAIEVEGYDPEAEAEAEEEVVTDSAEVSSSSEEDPYAGYVPLIDLDGDGVYDTTEYGYYLYDTDGDGIPDESTIGEELADTDGDGIPDASPGYEEEEEEVISESGEEIISGSTDGETEDDSDEAVSADSTEDSGVLQAVMEKTSDTEFHPALTDVTMVTGLTDQELKVGDTIETEDDSIFATIQALTKIISKLSIKPDSIELDEKYNMTLHYGDITVMIGQDSLLEEKMARVSAILPKLDGKTGTLHLESFTSDTVNIVFDEES